MKMMNPCRTDCGSCEWYKGKNNRTVLAVLRSRENHFGVYVPFMPVDRSTMRDTVEPAVSFYATNS